MKLITETIEEAKVVITEGKSGQKNHFIEGIFLQGDLKNRNGRMYPVGLLEREVTKYDQSYIQKGRALGELGHPEGPTINLDRVSHSITSLKKKAPTLLVRRVFSIPLWVVLRNHFLMRV